MKTIELLATSGTIAVIFDNFSEEILLVDLDPQTIEGQDYRSFCEVIDRLKDYEVATVEDVIEAFKPSLQDYFKCDGFSETFNAMWDEIEEQLREGEK